MKRGKMMRKYNISYLDYLEVCRRRGTDDDNLYQKVNKGMMAENQLYEMLEDHFQDRVVDYDILADIHLESYQSIQIDLLILTPAVIWLIEVKNYQGVLRHEGTDLYLNDYCLERNEIEHCRIRKRVLENILRKYLSKIPPIKSSLFLMHKNSEYERSVDLEDIDIVTLNAANRVIREWIQETKQLPKISQMDKLKKVIKREEVDSFFLPRSLSEADKKRIIRGAICPKCMKKMQVKSRKLLFCPRCDRQLSKKQAVYQAYFDLCVLNYNCEEPIKAKDIYWLTGGIVSKQSIRSTMAKLLINFEGNHIENCYPNFKAPLIKAIQHYPGEIRISEKDYRALQP